MRKGISSILVILITISLFSISIQGQAQTVINPDSCLSYLSMDFETGDVLYSYNSDMKIYPASTTKLLTALVAVENCPLNKVFTTSKNATRFLEDGSGELDLLPDETMDFYSLLHGLLIRSFNDVALVIAENVAGSEEEFMNMMNQKAQELGAVNSHFVTPHGLHDDEHYTTALDLAIIARAAFSNFTISTICAKKEYSLPATNLRQSFDLIKNTNLILGTNTGYDFTVTAGKTGFTSKAQNVLVALSSDYSGREVITVITGVKDRVEAAEITLELMAHSYEDFGIQCIAQAGQIIDNHEGINIANAMRLEHLVPYDSQSWTLDKTFDYRSDIIYSQVDIGDIVGEVTYSYNGNYIGKSYIVAANSLKPVKNDIDITQYSEDIDVETAKVEYDKPFVPEFAISLGISVLLLVLIVITYYKTRKHEKKNEDKEISDQNE